MQENLLKNCTTYILGELNRSHSGAETVNSLRKYNLQRAFGTNGVDIDRGFTTPDVKEAMVKEEALHRSRKVCLCDQSKFDEISSITFGDIKEAKIITTNLEENSRYKQETEIVEVES